MNFESFKELIHNEVRRYMMDYISDNRFDLGFINEDGEEWYEEEFIPYMFENEEEEDGEHSDRFTQSQYYCEKILSLMCKFRFKFKKELGVLQKKANYNHNDISIHNEWLKNFEDKNVRDKVILNEYITLYIAQNMSYTILKEICCDIDVPAFYEELEILK